MAKYTSQKVGELHRITKKKPDSNGWMWVIGIVVFLIILAAA
tara:strand:- start:161 stop:286 length:126 start_codon:yes stop_codon:yes gene_type:complete